MSRSIRTFGLGLLVVSTLSTFGFAAERLRVGMAIPSYAHGVLWVARDAGIFKKHGLDVDVLVLQGSADAMKLLVAEKVDVVLAGGDAMIKADLAGADLVVFAGIVNRFFHRIVARPDIQKPEQLKGRVIGLPILGGPQEMAVQVALKRWGLRYGTDVKVRNMGAEFARLTAVKNGLVDAVTSDAPASVLRKLDLRVLGDVPAWGDSFPYMMAIARRDFLKKDERRTEAFLKALTEAMEYYRDHEKESVAIVAKGLGGERASETEAAELYRQNGPAIFTFPPYPKPDGFKTVLDFLREQDPKAAAAKPEQFFTDEYLDAARGTGNKPK